MNTLLCRAIGRLETLEVEERFCLQDLFTEREWSSVESTISLGKKFKKLVDTNVLGVIAEPNTGGTQKYKNNSK